MAPACRCGCAAAVSWTAAESLLLHRSKILVMIHKILLTGLSDVSLKQQEACRGQESMLATPLSYS